MAGGLYTAESERLGSASGGLLAIERAVPVMRILAILSDWTVLPADRTAVRDRCEYSHAAPAILNFSALAATTIAVSEPRGR